jgi:DNA-binding transcriptional ArsR family regulator
MLNMTVQADALTLTFSALADPTRRAILEKLSDGVVSVKELAAPFKISLPAISRHLKVLERAGLIARGRDAQWRPAQLQAEPLKDVSVWLERYRSHWEQSYDRLDEYLADVQKKSKKEQK